MTPRQAIPIEWAHLLGPGRITLGHDIATTTKGTSNWSTLAVIEHASPLYIVRLLARWRTTKPEHNLDFLDAVVSDIESTGRRASSFAVDASNEKYHADRIRTFFMGRVPVDLVVAGEKIVWRGESYDYKTLLGDLYSAAFEDNCIALPSGIWIRDDHRLVGKEGARYVTELGKDGGHGDTFDAGKLAYWGQCNTAPLSPGSVRALQVGDIYGKAKPVSSISNPLGHLFRQPPTFRA
jgi:hypothetical protein